MRAGVIIAILVTVILVAVAGIATGLTGFFMLAVALNGFMGQPRAVETSMYTYMASAALVVMFGAALSALSVYLLSGRRMWNAAGSAALSTTVFSLAGAVFHFVCLLAAVFIAVALVT